MNNTVNESINRNLADLLTEDPIRDELFSIERLELYAAHLANQLVISFNPRLGRSLLPNLKRSGAKLLKNYNSLIVDIRSKKPVVPAAEWFVNNFHIIEDQLRSIKQDLPQDYYDELPKLATGELKGYPQVYAMAMAIIAHTDSRLDTNTLRRFIQAYQRVSQLKIGEVWAIAITLRIALLEHLIPLTERIVRACKNSIAADALADQLLELAIHPEAQPYELVQLLSRKLGSPENYDRAFIVQLIQRLRDQDPDVHQAFDWLEKQLQTHHRTNTLQVVHFEHQHQAAAQVTIGNIISSLRFLSTLDWRDFFESVNLVDPVLAQDPAGAFSKMDFQTRDRYRHEVERIARRSTGEEIEISRKAVELSMAAKTLDPSNQQSSHIGYYLIGEGLPQLERVFGYRPRFIERIHRLILRYPTFFYLGSITGLISFFIIPLYGLNWAILLLASFPASELALSILNYYITLLINPQVLPKMETTHGLPYDARTMVVIPSLFTSSTVVRGLLESLELHYLGNQDPVLSFALLGDFTDADVDSTPDDEAILSVAQFGIDELNARYSTSPIARFYLFHRRRQWNPSEGKWIGWERKRGKLLEFNRLLRGANDTSYLGKLPDSKFLSGIKYVITLDSDTKLPRGAAHQLIGTIVHPLNQPVYNDIKKRVTAGYGILQPRISVELVSATWTRFAKLYSGNTGLDPYTTAVSDVYQDLFAEGSFTGKGLYVVDAFELALADRVPENVVLSHDLFEGSYARSALVTDVELFDDYPSDYETFSKRAHRWTRGDWQISPWLFPWVSDAQGRRVPNHLSLISRWKIFDNLRRSLVPIATLLWLILAWIILPGSPAALTLPILILLAFPIYAPILSGAALRRDSLPLRGYLLNGLAQTKIRLGQVFLMIAFLPDHAWTQADAISRTLYRKAVSGKKLLEWMTFAQTHLKNRNRISSIWEFIVPGPLMAFLIGSLIVYFRMRSLPFASPFLLLWLTAPFIKRWVNQKSSHKATPLSQGEVRTFLRYARRTWHYFETFVGAADHWLAPDNFQIDPKPVVAHRTSPTNIGLQLLATASAFDLGYLGFLEYIESLEKIFLTLDKLEKMHGHFFNWYNTLTLEPLSPRYISTVDSGNLAGHLLALKQACRELAEDLGSRRFSKTGLTDTLHELFDEACGLEGLIENPGKIPLKQLQDSIADCLKLTSLDESEDMLSWSNLLTELSLRLAECENILTGVVTEESPDKLAETRIWLMAVQRQVQEFQRDLLLFESNSQREVRPRLLALMAQCDELVLGMDFRFLFDQERKLFVIGYNVSESRRDNSYYDLLASESRLASFVAIAKGEVPQEHWFQLGRKMATTGSSRALIAWTATMFEYLMPLLVMRRYNNTLLDQTYDAVVARQIEYGDQHGVPWGISEAGYNARDLQLNFQYGPFGIPGLGLKRGLSDELVISPYSTMLAAMVDPRAALANLEILSETQAFSRYGFFESIDYTPARLPANQKSFILRSFMSHHQGMSLVSINNLLNDSVMQRRFHSDPLVQATELLLQERIPKAVALLRPRPEEVQAYGTASISSGPSPRFYSNVNQGTPRTQFLSNGTYSVMVTSAGSGYSRCGHLAVNRWREDLTRDNWGQYIYIRKKGSTRLWSSGFQPTLLNSEEYAVTFAEDKVEISRRDEDISTHTEIIVSTEDNVELRRVTLTNHGLDSVDIETTSYMEVVLALPEDDTAHPAFSNLFVQTEFIPEESAILATRRRRFSEEKQPWGFHVLVTEGEVLAPIQYETDRAQFIGRGRDASLPIVITENRPLTGTIGSVLDPIFSLRNVVRIPPGETVHVLFATGIADTREDALRLSDKYHDIHVFTRAANLAWIQSRIQLRHLNIDINQAHNFQRLAGRIIYSDPSLRPRPHLLGLNTKAQDSLWAYGISGDFPIILSRISDERDMIMVRELLHGHEYLRLKGLSIDLVILNERPSSYLQSLQDELQRQIRISGSKALLDKPGGIFIRRADIIPAGDLLLLKTVARVVLSAEKGTLEEQLTRRIPVTDLPKNLNPRVVKQHIPEKTPIIPKLKFFNGMGGFTEDTREYVIILKEGQWTPAPWINVVANALDFGFLISESGSGYTWSTNSRENRLTSWMNDAVSDPVSEAIYIRDEDTGEYWSPTPLPIRETETYFIRHGQGYTQFEHTSHGIEQELHISVPLDATIKISRLQLKNLTQKNRRLSVISYVEWVLGSQRSVTAPTVITEIDDKTGAIFARNPFNNEFTQRVAFAEMVVEHRSFTCDRKEFLGRNGNTTHPAALRRINLSNTSGAGLDPCAAFQTTFTLRPGEEREFIILLGQAENAEKARTLVALYQKKETARIALLAVLAYWNQTLGVIEIKTPDDSMNTLVNRWLLYQALSCRIWARSGFYQSGGAIGFRDQLQDVMALVYSRPELARQQILTAAARQFEEGDVQHWWHPPSGRGVRTNFSDDLLWLPFVVTFYVSITGDFSVMEESVPFISAAELEAEQNDSYFLPRTSSQVASIFEHCVRALDRSLKTGSHGLPLMGSGDWNDGMNRVGHRGKGESVWLGWFLHRTLSQFIPFCEKSGQSKRASDYRRHAEQIKAAIETYAWDGAWYRRAFFDDGYPLGSSINKECQIDSIAQSWAVLSGVGDSERARQAMKSVNEHLVNYREGLVKLFTPPFDQGTSDPGYIKGYVPGVRENGGQYTHAAIWAMMAYAEQGDGDQAGNLFSMLNPINHAATRAGVNRYKVEPYVMAGDIYALSPHVGRGGWTWYTGSASWMYRAALESILGFELRAKSFSLKPCLPKHWPGFEMIYRRGATQYLISVSIQSGQTTKTSPLIWLDGILLSSTEISIQDDFKIHTVKVDL